MKKITGNKPLCKAFTGRGHKVPLNQNPDLANRGFSCTFEDRFWEKVNKTNTCWIWTGCKTPTGYGQIARGGHFGGAISAHVASWILHNGRIPDGLSVLHDCPGGDNRACVRPSHLWIGTQRENCSDAALKGKHAKKLTKDQVLEIRLRYKANSRIDGGHALAREFGVDNDTIYRIVTRQTWNHI